MIADVTGHTLYVGVWDDRLQRKILAPVIERETRIPCENAYRFQSAGQGQRMFRVEVYQGEGVEIYPEEVTMIGAFDIEIAPSDQPTPLQVAFRLNDNDILEVSATEALSGHRQSCMIDYQDSARISPDELAKKEAPLQEVVPQTRDLHEQIEKSIKQSKTLVGQGRFEQARKLIRKLPDTPEDLVKLKTDLLGQINEAQEQSKVHEQVEKSVKQSKTLVGQGRFEEARKLIQKLPGTPRELLDLKKNLLSQINEAQEQSKVHGQIEKVVKQSRTLVGQGKFKDARKSIRSLPDTPRDLVDLKKNLLGQVDEVEAGQQRVSEENAQLTKELTRRGVDLSTIHELAKMNNLDISDPNALNALLKMISQHMSVHETQHRHSGSGEHPSSEDGKSPSTTPMSLGRFLRSRALRKKTTGSTTMPGVLNDLVHFSLTSVPEMKPGDFCHVYLWAHLERQRLVVIERAKEEADRSDIRIKTKGPVRVARGTELTVRLSVDGLAVDPAEDTIQWEGEIGNAQFRVTAPADAPFGPRPGVACVFVAGHRIARLFFALGIGPRTADYAELPAQEERHRSAFVSYASEDEHDVLRGLQGLQKGVPGLDLFYTEASLFSGEKWQERLREEIMHCDVMYLFWSAAASRSRWVDWEWRTGWKERGIDFIDPFPLVHPQEVPPPKELADELHFNDWVLAFMRSCRGSAVAS